MIFDQFLPSAHPTAQSQPQGEDRASPSLAGGRVKKKQRVVDQPPRVTREIIAGDLIPPGEHEITVFIAISSDVSYA
ncbi:hypothetical protein CFP56_004447 [Quercus suber]|uniref:Uncharacterized protein n=1 Tax=Quercus suber TaxID=58331 RepID=A0AAW0LCD9_QUESU